MAILGVWCQQLTFREIGVMDMINMLDFAENSLYTTFPNLRSSKSAISADLSQSQKNHILKKIGFFWSKIGSREVKTGPIGKRG